MAGTALQSIQENSAEITGPSSDSPISLSPNDLSIQAYGIPQI